MTLASMAQRTVFLESSRERRSRLDPQPHSRWRSSSTASMATIVPPSSARGLCLRRRPRLAEAVISVLRAGGKLLLCGNGGSAADAQHIATEFTVRFETTRPRPAGDRADHRHLGADRGEQRPRLRAGLRPPGRGARPARRHADRHHHLRPLRRTSAPRWWPRAGRASPPPASPAATAARSLREGLADHCLIVPHDKHRAHPGDAHLPRPPALRRRR